MNARNLATIIDTNAILALLDRNDRNHLRARAMLPTKLLIPTVVLPEVDYLASTRLGSMVARAFLRSVVRGDMKIIHSVDADMLRSLELQDQYADLNLGLVDSTVIATAERLGIQRVFTFDRRHFSVVRPKNLEYLDLIP